MSSFPNSGTVYPIGEGVRCAPTEPSSLLVRFSRFLPHSGLGLDLACGYGRNTLYLARQGLEAIGIDRSLDALVAGREDAARENLKVSFVQADLTRFAFPTNAFSVVVCFKYRDRNWYPSIRAALRPGGLLVYETYTFEHLGFGLKPLDPAHLLGRNELLQAFGDWEILYYREVWRGRGTASLVARKPGPHAEC
ncbi:MAG TPA: class I SAM-dependent methyltransferase [Terriglobia bacterium]|nr:class I SAM-dependent methyltransferase [Terriglobia bacterium]